MFSPDFADGQYGDGMGLNMWQKKHIYWMARAVAHRALEKVHSPLEKINNL
jgi:hypothetical protein